MFSYRPPKGSIWGHAIYPRNAFVALQKMRTFFEKYFEPVLPEHLTLNLNPHGDKGNHIPKIREKLISVFGRPGQPESMDWVLAPNDYLRMVDAILECQPFPKHPGDPLWISFKCHLDWKTTALPKVEWPEEFLRPDPICEKLRRQRFTVRLGGENHISFIMGIGIPISTKEPASYDFLGRFSADAPFKMSAKHFQAATPIGKKGNLAWRKPDAEIAGRLQEVIK